MTLKKLNILNLILLFTVFAVLAIVASDALVYKRAIKGVRSAPVAVAPKGDRVPIMEYAPIVERPVLPGRAQSFTPSASSAVPATAMQSAEGAGILKKIRLKGTYVSERRSSESFAIFTNSGTGAEESFRVGDAVFGHGHLSSVEQRRVTVTSGPNEFLFEMPETEKATNFTPTLPAASRPTDSTANSTNGDRGRALKYSRKISETEWVINQDAVLGAMDDMSKVLSDARMTPVTTDGKVDGFRVTEIRPAGIFDAIGLKNNDVLKRVNNYEMTSPERAIQVLSALKGERNFTIDIERNGKKVSLNYRVR